MSPFANPSGLLCDLYLTAMLRRYKAVDRELREMGKVEIPEGACDRSWAKIQTAICADEGAPPEQYLGQRAAAGTETPSATRHSPGAVVPITAAPRRGEW